MVFTFLSNGIIYLGVFCNVTWDNISCWPPAPAGTVVTRYCAEAFQESHPIEAKTLQGMLPIYLIV